MRQIVIRLKGGPGSGHRGHAGRPGLVGGSAPGVGVISGRGTKVALAIKRMMPEKNRRDLDIPATGLPDASVRSNGDPIIVLAYNPTTDTLVAGSKEHADLVVDYGGGKYDDFVKVAYDTPYRKGIGGRLYIDITRVNYRDKADAWDKGFKTAQALRDAGYPTNTAVELTAPGKEEASWYDLGEMTKEVGGDGWIMESTLGALLAIKPSVKVTLKMAYPGISI